MDKLSHYVFARIVSLVWRLVEGRRVHVDGNE